LWDQQCGKPCFKDACQSGNACQNHCTITFGELASSGFPHWISLHVLLPLIFNMWQAFHIRLLHSHLINMSSFQEKIKNPAKCSSVHYWSIFDCLQLFPTNDGILFTAFSNQWWYIVYSFFQPMMVYCLQLFPTNDGILKSQIAIVSDIMKNCSKQYE
jgi:quinol-cytochrome oxidoreductase complex cytochrome b subunit